MPTWIKTKKEDYTIDEQYDVVDINSFSEMQQLAYDLVKSHFDDLLVLQVLVKALLVLQVLVKVTLSMLFETFYRVNVLLLLPQVKQRIT